MHLDNINTPTHQGWLLRHEKAKAKIAAERDPRHIAVQKVRALLRTAGEAEAGVRRAWDEEHILVHNPLPAMMHPQVAERILSLLRDSGLSDFVSPLNVADTLADRLEKAGAAERAELRAAEAELAAIEVQYAAYDAIVAAGPMAGASDVEPVELVNSEPVRGRGRPPKHTASSIVELTD